jgi:hypothetical protein
VGKQLKGPRDLARRRLVAGQNHGQRLSRISRSDIGELSMFLVASKHIQQVGLLASGF